MYTLEEVAILDDAYKFVERWGGAHYDAEFDDTTPVVLELDGEDALMAAKRWTFMVAGVRGNAAAAAFEAAAAGYLKAQSVLGAAERAADAVSVPVRWKAVGRAEFALQLAERALQEVSVPNAVLPRT